MIETKSATILSFWNCVVTCLIPQLSKTVLVRPRTKAGRWGIGKRLYRKIPGHCSGSWDSRWKKCACDVRPHCISTRRRIPGVEPYIVPCEPDLCGLKINCYSAY